LHRSFPGPSWHREAVMSRVDEMDQEMMGQRESLPEELLPAIRCVQCGKCSSGCPVAFDTCHTPRRLLRFLQWGWLEEAGRSPFASLCAQCQTCTVRCPRGIEVSEVILALRRVGRARGWVKPDTFHKTLEKMIEERGRISELRLGLLAAMGKIPAHPVEELVLFFKMLLRGKLP
jgi:heterodisulfide reductase subunit C